MKSQVINMVPAYIANQPIEQKEPYTTTGDIILG
jgi:hypothetical protein